MQQPFPPCPVCGGTQAFFNGDSGYSSIVIHFGDSVFSRSIKLGALICLDCGHTDLRPHPHDMQRLRRVVEKRGLLP